MHLTPPTILCLVEVSHRMSQLERHRSTDVLDLYGLSYYGLRTYSVILMSSEEFSLDKIRK